MKYRNDLEAEAQQKSILVSAAVNEAFNAGIYRSSKTPIPIRINNVFFYRGRNSRLEPSAPDSTQASQRGMQIFESCNGWRRNHHHRKSGVIEKTAVSPSFGSTCLSQWTNATARDVRPKPQVS